jgi:hypothetical protein
MPKPRTRRRKNKKRTTIRKKRGGAVITSTRTTDAENHSIKNTMDIKNADPNKALMTNVFVSNIKYKLKLFPSMEQGNHIFKSLSGIPDTELKTTDTQIVVNGDAESQQRQLFEAINIDSFKNAGFFKQIEELYKIKTGVKLDDIDLTQFEEYAKAHPKKDKQPENNDVVAPPLLMDLLPDMYKNIPDIEVEKIMEPLVSNGFDEIYTKGEPATYDNVRWAIVLKALSEEPDETKKAARKNREEDQSLNQFLSTTAKNLINNP